MSQNTDNLDGAKRFTIRRLRYHGIRGRNIVLQNTIKLNYSSKKVSGPSFSEDYDREFSNRSGKTVNIVIRNIKEFDSDKLLDLLEEAMDSEKDSCEPVGGLSKFERTMASMPVTEWGRYLEISSEDKTYYISVSSELGRLIAEETKYDELWKLSNKEFFDLVSLEDTTEYTYS